MDKSSIQQDVIDADRQAVAAHIDAGPLLVMMERLGGRAGLVVVFALAHGLLMQLGYAFKPSIADPAVMWPAAGMAFVTLWLTPQRLWPLLLAVQFVVEVATAAVWMQTFRPGLVTLYTVGNMAGALVGAALAGWQIRDRLFLRAREVLWFVLVTAVSAMVSATIGTVVHTWALGRSFELLSYLQLWQVWCAGQWVGIMTIAPLVAFWTSPLRERHPELRLRSRLEVLALAGLLLAASLPLAGWMHGQVASLLQLPTTVLLLMIVVVMRLPPRWAVLLYVVVSLSLAVVAVDAGRQLAPERQLLVVGQLQMLLVTLGVFAFALSVTLAERSITARMLQESQYRYRSFVQRSTEALWRIELDQPMPVDLPQEQQLAWLRRHARIAEFSRSYEQLDPQAAGTAGSLPWRPELPWVAALEGLLGQAAAQGYSLDGVRFGTHQPEWQHTFLASFDGVVENGRLLRLWGVARDITELVELNDSLLLERERLKSYARQLGNAEESARRATAVDLHDGIGQSLVGMAMTLDVARQHANPEVKLLIEEVRVELRDVQERTRNMISDLSPPGLYELGLTPALQWLAVYMRTHDRLKVQLDADVREESVRLEMRVLVFKLVRELLRNVVRHAGVDAARVQVRGGADELRVEVTDQGRGFEWQMDMFGSTTGGFGLWSVADRVNEVGGQFHVDTAPGRGTRLELVFPLRQEIQGRTTRPGSGASMPA